MLFKKQMGVDIHTSAIVDPKAELGENVVVDAFAMVGPHAELSAMIAVVFHHATVEGRVSLGSRESYSFLFLDRWAHS